MRRDDKVRHHVVWPGGVNRSSTFTDSLAATLAAMRYRQSWWPHPLGPAPRAPARDWTIVTPARTIRAKVGSPPGAALYIRRARFWSPKLVAAPLVGAAVSFINVVAHRLACREKQKLALPSEMWSLILSFVPRHALAGIGDELKL